MAMWFGASLGGSVVFPCFNPLQGDSVSSVGFYGCVGGVSLLQSLAGGQWFIGSVVCSSVRCRAVSPTHFFIGSVAYIGGRLYPLAGYNGSGVSL